MTDIQKLIAGRVAIDRHRNRNVSVETEEEHAESTLQMYSDLESLGFSSGHESFFEFMKFNKDMCYKEFIRVHPIKGDCGDCDEPPTCLLKFVSKPEKRLHGIIYPKRNEMTEDAKNKYFDSIIGCTKKTVYTEKLVPDFDIEWK
jgi:hypothetical protein